MKISADIICDVGRVRSNNEDMVLINGELLRDRSARYELELSGSRRFAAAIADGMGGYEGGEIASEIVAKSFDDFICALPGGATFDLLSGKIARWARQTQETILDQGRKHPHLGGMGTTFCCLFIYENHILTLNVGDSRMYRFREGILKQITTDHSMRKLTGDVSVPVNVIYNSFGGNEDVFVDIRDISSQVFENDIFLLCSDGLTDMLDDAEIENMLSAKASARHFADKANDAGGKDNISVAILKIKKMNGMKIREVVTNLDEGAIVNPPATEREIAECNRDLAKEGLPSLPEGISGFLKICNGLEYNGMQIFGCDPEEITYHTRMNCENYGLEGLLVFGRIDDDIYTYNASEDKYEARDITGMEVWNEYESFDDFFAGEMMKWLRT